MNFQTKLPSELDADKLLAASTLLSDLDGHHGRKPVYLFLRYPVNVLSFLDRQYPEAHIAVQTVEARALAGWQEKECPEPMA